MKSLRVVALLTACTGLASGYYHYVHFNTRGPWIPIFEKFDLNALPNRSVPFFINEPGSVQLAPSDSVAGLISQVRAGAKVWNDVATSELRIAFGGIVPTGTQYNSPVVEVLFEEMEPGVVAYGGPQVLADYNGAFIPIQRAQVVLNRNLTTRPSYSEQFFRTLVHEFGHALGLQHTFTSSAMATDITRATSKARPLMADDVAALSVLYPTSAFTTRNGTVTGRVRLGDQDVNLASVVALSPNGPAVSSMTNPDGTYRIEGLPPGQYLLYVHPLPPPLTWKNEVTPGNITYPVGPDGRPITPDQIFESQFFPGVRDLQQALPITVTAGQATEGVNFSVRGRNTPQLHSVETYGFPAQVATKPAYLHPASSRAFLVAGGPGVTINNAPLPNLSATVIGGSSLALRPYAPGGTATAYAQLDVDVRSFFFSNDGPRHLLFSSPSELYLLPSGFYQVAMPPPSITEVTSAADGSGRRVALLSGSFLGDQTRVLFDGVAGVTRGLDDGGRLIVAPPPAPAGHRANVVALNPDGQSSLFLQSDPPAYAFDGGAELSAAVVTLTPAAVPAGTDALVTIDAAGISFDGPVSVGFGTSDVAVRRVWIASPTRLLASVSVAPNAWQNVTGVTITNGLQTIIQPFAFAVSGLGGRTVSLSANVVNSATGSSQIWPGVLATATVTNSPVPLNSAPLTLFFNDRQIPVTLAGERQIAFTIPAGTTVGPATLRLLVGTDSGLPVVFAIDPVPPQITRAQINSVPVEATSGAAAGDLLTLSVTGLAAPEEQVNPARVLINVGGVELAAGQVTPSGSSHQVIFLLPPSLKAGTVPVTVTYDGRTSAVYPLVIR